MRLEVPQLKGYTGAIQANNSMANAFRNLSGQSQDYLDAEERKRRNKWSESFQEKGFDYNKNRDVVKDDQWKQGFDETKQNNSWNRIFKDKTFDHKVNQDGISNDLAKKRINIAASNANKPSYTTFNGVDENGNPVLNMIDKRTGKVINTGQSVYQAPKQLTPEQAQYYNDRSTDMVIKTNAKAMEQLSAIDGWGDLDTQSQKQALDYYLKNGITPKIKNTGWFDGDPRLDIPLTQEQKDAKSKKLAEDMKALGL